MTDEERKDHPNTGFQGPDLTWIQFAGQAHPESEMQVKCRCRWKTKPFKVDGRVEFHCRRHGMVAYIST